MIWESQFDKAFEYTNGIVGAFQWLSCKYLFQAALQCPGTIVEVGVDQGRSASLLLAAAQITGAKVVLVDSWESVLIDNKTKVEKVVADFPNVPVTILNMFSSAAAKHVVGPLDLVHIDANHYDEHPDEDCRLWLPKLKSGGFACFHDYESCFPAVTEAINKHTGKWELIGTWESETIRRKPQ